MYIVNMPLAITPMEIYCSKFVRDAVPMLGTSASVALIRDEIISGRLGEIEAGIWLSSMAFIANPTKAIFEHLKVSSRSDNA